MAKASVLCVGIAGKTGSIALGLCETEDMVREVKRIDKASSTDSAFITFHIAAG